MYVLITLYIVIFYLFIYLFIKPKKNVKITKRAHAFKGFASSYIFKILIFFNPELQLKR